MEDRLDRNLVLPKKKRPPDQSPALKLGYKECAQVRSPVRLKKGHPDRNLALLMENHPDRSPALLMENHPDRNLDRLMENHPDRSPALLMENHPDRSPALLMENHPDRSPALLAGYRELMVFLAPLERRPLAVSHAPSVHPRPVLALRP